MNQRSAVLWCACCSWWDFTIFEKKSITLCKSRTACPNTHPQYSTMNSMQYSTLYSKLDRKKTCPGLFLSNATPLIVHARDVAVPFWRGRLLRVNWHQQLNLLLDFWKNQKIFTTKIACPCFQALYQEIFLLWSLLFKMRPQDSQYFWLGPGFNGAIKGKSSRGIRPC